MATLHTKHCNPKTSDSWSEWLQERIKNEAKELLMARETTAQSSKTQTTPLLSTTYDSIVQVLLPCIVLHSLKQVVLSGYALMNAL